MIKTSIEGYYQWEIRNSVTGEIKQKGKAKNKINPKTFYYSFPKSDDVEHAKHYPGASYAAGIYQLGLSPVTIDPAEYVNSGIESGASRGNGPSPRRLDNLRLSDGNSANYDVSIEQNDSGEWCFVTRYVKRFIKGTAGTYHAICGGYFPKYHTEIHANLFTVVNLEEPIVLTDIDELTVTYSIYQKCPSVTEPIVKNININGREHTLSILIHPPRQSYKLTNSYFNPTIGNLSYRWIKHSVGIPFSSDVLSTMYPNLKYPNTTISAIEKSTTNSSGYVNSRLTDGWPATMNENSVTNISEPYPASVKNRCRWPISYEKTGKLDIFRWFVFGSIMEVEFTPTLEKTNEEILFFEWVVTHEVPNATE